MEERDLVRWEKDKSDRRICRIWLTDAGKELRNILSQISAELHEETWQGVPATKRALCSQLLDRAIANLT